jgi:anti-sigma B factor antagonist
MRRGRLSMPRRIGYIESMEWQVTKPGDGYDEIRISGDCDLYTAPGFATAMLEAIAGGTRRLRLDFSGVSYLDSSGVGAIIRILQESRRTGCELRFRGVEGSPRKVLRMSNILSLMREEPAARIAR